MAWLIRDDTPDEALDCDERCSAGHMQGFHLAQCSRPMGHAGEHFPSSFIHRFDRCHLVWYRTD